MKITIVGLLPAQFACVRKACPGVELEHVYTMGESLPRQRARIARAERCIVNTKFVSHSALEGLRDGIIRVHGGIGCVVEAVQRVSAGAGSPAAGSARHQPAARG